MASRRLVLITGINGYIAAHTAATFLKAGYSVRGTIRPGNVNTESVIRALSKYHDGDRLELVPVPDFGADGAFDGAVKGVHAIAHLASPVSMTVTDPVPMMRASVRGTTSLLASALAEREAGKGALESFVFMSTISAVFSSTRPDGHVFTESDWNDEAERQLAELGANTPGYVIYQASKTAAERAFWQFGQETGAGFAMTALCPAPVLGPPLFLPKSIQTLSMRVRDIHDLLQGGSIPEYSPIRGTFIDVRDVAELALKAVEQGSQTPNSRERYLLVGQSGVSPQQMADTLRAQFPERRNNIPEGNPGRTDYPESKKWGFDAGKARKLLGKPWIGFEQSVIESARVFLNSERHEV
ncbi:hypothetical protein VTK26DRAFT_1836 [Humicola hyalothermophila]